MKTLSRYLAPFTLAEWGAIMIYFYLSGRITSFLHPSFRALLFVTGILLVLTAAVLVIWGNEASCAHEHDHEGDSHCGSDHDHGSCGHDHHGHDHAPSESPHDHDHNHGQLTFGGAMAFLVLLLPVALAVKISPDSYGENLLRNRGTIENVAALPGVAKRMQKRAVTTYDVPIQPQSAQPQLFDPVTPKQAGTVRGAYQNPVLEPNADGNIKVEVIDLRYAAMDSTTRPDFEGKRVELIGQMVPLPDKSAKAGSFKLMRMFMVCCAADVQPVTVMVRRKESLPNFTPMAWLKVVGRVSFPTFGERPLPVVTADEVSVIKAPDEPYIY